MNRLVVALFSSCLSLGLASIPSAAFAANSGYQPPVTSKPAPQKPGADDCAVGGPMTGGWGYGHGMMFGHGGGMMDGFENDVMLESPRMDMVRSLNLSDQQRSAINKLSDELQHKNWGLLGQIRDETAKLRDLYEADKRDPAAIGAEYQKIFDLKRQIIESILVTQNRAEDLLTPEQLKQLREVEKSTLRFGHGPYGHPSRGGPMY